MSWYLNLYFRTSADLGLLPMYCNPSYVGSFAVSPAALSAADPQALFTMLIVTTMFQRLRDALVFKILRGITPPAASAITTQATLTAEAARCGCQHLRDAETLQANCDLTKKNGRGVCRANPNVACPLKSHTEVMKRYGHFGKVPTSAALVVAAEGGDLEAVRRRVFSLSMDPEERASLLLKALTRIWRVSDKIAAMFLSALTNRDLGRGLAPWTEGIDGTHFVVIDSNVDLFLAAIGYRGNKSYAARRSFVRAVAAKINLTQLNQDLSPFNPRLVQQAMYIFMGRSNRSANPRDCMHVPGSCARCPVLVRKTCPVRRVTRSP